MEVLSYAKFVKGCADMIVGVDIGYSATKTSEKNVFHSRFTNAGTASSLNERQRINLDGKSYFIGQGFGAMDVNRVNDDITRQCLFTALAMCSSTETHFKVVTGLPINQFDSQATALKQYIRTNNHCHVVYGGQERLLWVDDVKVYAQGAGALYSEQVPGGAIVVDIGGRTVNIALFEVVNERRSLAKSATLYCGMLPLLSKAVEAANRELGLDFSLQDGESVLKNELVVDGEHRVLTFLTPMKEEHFSELFSLLALNFPVRTTPIYVCGGGSYVMGSMLKAKYKNTVIMPDGQFSNAIGYRNIGYRLFK